MWFFQFLSNSSVILLSVDISAILSFISKNCKFSSAFSIANCSAWLFEQRPFNLYFFMSINLLFVNVAMPDPTPCSLLLIHTCSYQCFGGLLGPEDESIMILGTSVTTYQLTQGNDLVNLKLPRNDLLSHLP